MNTPLPPLPSSWSALSWQQLCEAWTVKMRYGGNADVAGAAALLTLALGDGCRVSRYKFDERTGETVYTIVGEDGRLWTTTPRELAWLAKETMPWFAYPYGDQGDKEETDDDGKVVKEQREGHSGYVNPDVGNWRDAMSLPQETITIGRRHFELPQVGIYNLTWQQYRTLQGITQQLFSEGIGDETALSLQAQFLAHILAPRSLALFDTNGNSIRLRLHWQYQYDTVRADKMVPWFEKRLRDGSVSTLFHICFQVYQTAIQFYSIVYYDLFTGSGSNDPLHTALTGESDTITILMKEGRFTSPQEVYEANVSFIFSVLNRMTKQAKEIEKMNSKIKRK